MAKNLNNDDLRVFIVVARRASFAAAASELGVSPSYITKRIHVLETDLGTRLFHRTTRHVVITDTGERVCQWAQRVLDDIDHLVEEVGVIARAPRGVIRISSSFGFGRRIVGPAIAGFAKQYPSLQVRFDVFDRIVDLAAEHFDLDIRVGNEISPNLIARKLATNYRVLCAAPAYLDRHGMPRVLADLAKHDCLIIKERDHPFGVWRLRSGKQERVVKVTGPLSSNNGEIAVHWAVEGHGILLRSIWDVGPLLREGKLVHVLPDYTQAANVWAVFPSRLETSAKVRVCVEWMAEALRNVSPAPAAKSPRPSRRQAPAPPVERR